MAYPNNNNGRYTERNNKDRNNNLNKKPEKMKREIIIPTEENYVDLAENVIKKIGRDCITTTKIRNLLSMAADIYNEMRSDFMNKTETSSSVMDRIRYLKIRFVYEAGRDIYSVKKFTDEACIVEMLDAVLKGERKFSLFYKYMEALVAYHRYYGGKDE